MKNIIFSFLLLSGLAFALFLLPACNKDDISNCETVIEGSQYLKVVNESGGIIFVDMTSIIPLGAEMSKGACELYGLPTGNHSITIENQSGPGSRDVGFDLSGGETFEVVVDKDFF